MRSALAKQRPQHQGPELYVDDLDPSRDWLARETRTDTQSIQIDKTAASSPY